MRRTSIGKFKVLVTIDCTMSHEQEVEATSMDEACRKALDEERVRQSLPAFNIDNGSIHPENAYIADPQNCVFHDAVCEGCGHDTPCEEAGPASVEVSAALIP